MSVQTSMRTQSLPSSPAGPLDHVGAEAGVLAADDEPVQVHRRLLLFLGGPQARVGEGVQGDRCGRGLVVVADHPRLPRSDAAEDALGLCLRGWPGGGPLVDALLGEPVAGLLAHGQNDR